MGDGSRLVSDSRSHRPPRTQSTQHHVNLSLPQPRRLRCRLVLNLSPHPCLFSATGFARYVFPPSMKPVTYVPLFSFLVFQVESDDYEQILASLELDIQKRQTRLSEIRLRERRTTLKVTLYTLAFWVVYVSLWYAQVLPMLSGHRPNTAFEKFVKGVPVLIGPIL